MPIKVIRRTRPLGPRTARYSESVDYSFDGTTSPAGVLCPLRKSSRSYSTGSFSSPRVVEGEILYEYKRMVDEEKSSRGRVRMLVPYLRYDRRAKRKVLAYRYDSRRIPHSWVMKNCHHVAWESVHGGKGEISLKYEDEKIPSGYAWTDPACPHSTGVPGGYTSTHSFVGRRGLRRRIVFVPVSDFIGSDAILLEGVTDTDWWDPFLPPPGSTLLEDHIRELDRIALDVMVPELDTGFSLPVFIGDLYQMKSVFRSLSNVGRDLRRFFTRLGKRSVKQGADRYLESVYGWIPFVSDVVTIFEKLWHLDEKISKYIAGANKRQTLHFQRGLAPPIGFKDPSWFDTSDVASQRRYYVFPDPVSTQFNATISYQGRREISDYEFHATMDYEYQIPRLIGLSDRMQKLYASLETFGVALSLEDIWEIVPFSFVVDWVLGIGDWLEDVEEINALPVNIVIHDYCRSIRYRLHHRANMIITQAAFDGPSTDRAGQSWPTSWPLDGFTPPLTEVNVESLTSYYRRAGQPVFDTALYPGLKTPKGLQLVSASALVAQRMFR